MRKKSEKIAKLSIYLENSPIFPEIASTTNFNKT